MDRGGRHRVGARTGGRQSYCSVRNPHMKRRTDMEVSPTAEHQRLIEDAARTKNWKRWGPYLSERQWATGGEDGLLGITDRQCRLCFALALWNGNDPILKERLFGLTGSEGNHGEDVKELYYYLDS